jgi:UV excision repair protein RAD23
MVSMGFTKQDSLEAFLACDRNAEVALNYLFEK